MNKNIGFSTKCTGTYGIHYLFLKIVCIHCWRKKNLEKYEWPLPNAYTKGNPVCDYL